MAPPESDSSSYNVSIRPVDSKNWRDVAALQVEAHQRNYVADPTYYLALCCYDGLWHPMAVLAGEKVIGFLMWAVDDEDGSCWLGGIIIDRRWQRRGLGRKAVEATIELLAKEHGYRDFALSYQPGNEAARRAYAAVGFEETGEQEDDEVVARLRR
jgi:diamine N-acetyltransferase